MKNRYKKYKGTARKSVRENEAGKKGCFMNAQMKKGILELTVLNEIDKSDIYGYELVKRLCEYYVDVDISSYYTILRRLNGKAYIQCYEGEVSGGPQRKYYSITEDGKKYLRERKLELQHMNQMNQQLGLA